MLIDFIFDEDPTVFAITGNNFPGCMRAIDKVRGHHIIVGDLGYKLKFRCSPTFDVDKDLFNRMLDCLSELGKPMARYDL